MFEHTNWMEYTNPLGEILTYRFTKWGRNKDIPVVNKFSIRNEGIQFSIKFN